MHPCGLEAAVPFRTADFLGTTNPYLEGFLANPGEYVIEQLLCPTMFKGWQYVQETYFPHELIPSLITLLKLSSNIRMPLPNLFVLHLFDTS